MSANREYYILTINREPQEKSVLSSVGMAGFPPSARARDAKAATAECLDNPLGLCRGLGGDVKWEPQEESVLIEAATGETISSARDAQAATAECLDNPLGLCRRLGGRRA